jgi:TP901 family phage tail tape measure protein
MNSWKEANLSSTDAAKVFFGTIAAGKTTTQNWHKGFGGIAPLAAAVGISFKDLMASTAALTATGMPASQAYSGLKAAISNILKPSDDAAKAAANLGIDFSAAALKSKGLIGILTGYLA